MIRKQGVLTRTPTSQPIAPERLAPVPPSREAELEAPGSPPHRQDPRLRDLVIGVSFLNHVRPSIEDFERRNVALLSPECLLGVFDHLVGGGILKDRKGPSAGIAGAELIFVVEADHERHECEWKAAKDVGGRPRPSGEAEVAQTQPGELGR